MVCDTASGVQQHAVRRSEVRFRIALQERFSIIEKRMIDLVQNYRKCGMYALSQESSAADDDDSGNDPVANL
jgi:hypothetical protein